MSLDSPVFMIFFSNCLFFFLSWLSKFLFLKNLLSIYITALNVCGYFDLP